MTRSRLTLITTTLFAVGLLVWVAYGAALQWVYRQIEPPAPAERVAIPGLPNASANTCRACHPSQYEEWRQSKMGRAMTDPIFLADYEAQGRPFVCLRCHAPLDAQQPQRIDGLESLIPLVGSGIANPDFNPELQHEGVTCVSCHQVGEALVAGIENPQGAPHPAHGDPTFREAKTCAPCHQLAPPPLSGLDRALPDTVAEHRRWQQITERTDECVDCHMTEVQRPAALGGPIRTSHTHRFPGAWDDDLVRGAVTIEQVQSAPGVVRVTLQNHAGHDVPTAEPSRALIVRATRNGHDIGEAVLRRSIPLPRLRDEGDNSLRPGERRTIDIALPDGLPATEVSVWFDRLFSPAVPISEDVIPMGHRTVRIAQQAIP